MTIVGTFNELGTAIINMSFVDEDDNVVVPKTLSWQLQRSTGHIVNDRTFDSCSCSEGQTQVVLTGNDLALFGVLDDGQRIFSVQGTYDSDAGTDLSLTDQCTFSVLDLFAQKPV